MIIERDHKDIIFRIPADTDIDELQEFADMLEFKEISKASKATQKEVDKLAKEVKKGRWQKTHRKIGL